MRLLTTFLFTAALLDCFAPGRILADSFQDAATDARAALDQLSFPIATAVLKDPNVNVDAFALTADWQRVHSAVLSAFKKHFSCNYDPDGFFWKSDGIDALANASFVSNDQRFQEVVVRALFNGPHPRIQVARVQQTIRNEMPIIADEFLTAPGGPLKYSQVEKRLLEKLKSARLTASAASPRPAGRCRVQTSWYRVRPVKNLDAWTRQNIEYRMEFEVTEKDGRTWTPGLTYDSGSEKRITIEPYVSVRRKNTSDVLLRVGPLSQMSYAREREKYLSRYGEKTITRVGSGSPSPEAPKLVGDTETELASIRTTSDENKAIVSTTSTMGQDTRSWFQFVDGVLEGSPAPND